MLTLDSGFSLSVRNKNDNGTLMHCSGVLTCAPEQILEAHKHPVPSTAFLISDLKGECDGKRQSKK